MLTKLERSLGFSPAFLRIAYHYLSRGKGIYDVTQHPHYDSVRVRELYEFAENPTNEGEFAGGIIVEFLKEKQRIKYVEFRCQTVGMGGEPLVLSIPPVSSD